MSDALREIADPRVAKLLLYRSSPWEFATQCVRTLDETDKWTPIKPFPSELLYLKYLMETILNEKLLALVKSRRMFCTWAICIIALWDAMLHEGRNIAIVSKKEEDSDDLVQRCKFIYDNIPEDALPIKPVGEYKYTEFAFKEINSKIVGVAQGPDQLRQYTCSRVFADEIAFWPQAKETINAMKPTLEGGGQACLISTRYPGYFKELIEDTFDDEKGWSQGYSSSKSRSPIEVQAKTSPMEGIVTWRNPKNGYKVIDLSYKADPRKRSEEWLHDSRSGMARSIWEREYGDTWVVYDGKPVYQTYDEERHLATGTIVVPRRARLISGWDAGPNDINLAWVLGLAVPDEMRVIWIDEYFADDGDGEDFVQTVVGRLRLEWAKIGGFSVHVADQSVFTKSSIVRNQAISSIADIMRKHMIFPIPGEISISRRRVCVEEMLERYDKWKVHERCVMLREGMKGGYAYGKHQSGLGGMYKEVPLKNKFSHIANAMEYACSRMRLIDYEIPYGNVKHLPQVSVV